MQMVLQSIFTKCFIFKPAHILLFVWWAANILTALTDKPCWSARKMVSKNEKWPEILLFVVRRAAKYMKECCCVSSFSNVLRKILQHQMWKRASFDFMLAFTIMWSVKLYFGENSENLRTINQTSMRLHKVTDLIGWSIIQLIPIIDENSILDPDFSFSEIREALCNQSENYEPITALIERCLNQSIVQIEMCQQTLSVSRISYKLSRTLIVWVHW